MLFELVSIVHILVWLFIVFAWTNIEAARLNLFYVVPMVYILHILPVHLFTEMKKRMRPESWEQDDKNVQGMVIFPRAYDALLTFFQKCTYNPLSPQGMLILGAITSAWALRQRL